MRIPGRLPLKARSLTPVLALACALLQSAPARPDDAEKEFAAFEKIDVHMHLYGDMPEFVKRAHEDGFRVLTINVNYADFPPLAQQLHDAVALRRAYPDRIAFAATFDAAGSERPGWLARTRSRISRRHWARAPSPSRCGRTSACSNAMPMAARS